MKKTPCRFLPQHSPIQQTKNQLRSTMNLKKNDNDAFVSNIGECVYFLLKHCLLEPQ